MADNTDDVQLLKVVFTVHNMALCSLYSLAFLIVTCRFKCRLDCAVMMCMLIFWVSFALKILNWGLLDYDEVENYGIFKSVDVATSQLINLTLYFFTFEMLIVKYKLEGDTP